MSPGYGWPIPKFAAGEVLSWKQYISRSFITFISDLVEHVISIGTLGCCNAHNQSGNGQDSQTQCYFSDDFHAIFLQI